MDILFYIYKNVHIPLFEPIMQEILRTHPDWQIFKTAPAYEPKERYGLSDEDMEVAQALPGTWILNPDMIHAHVAVVADSVAWKVRKHDFVVNIGHGLISKGRYYCQNEHIHLENHADLICVPGPWHKEQLDKLVDIPVEATGFSSLDMFFKPFDKQEFCYKIGLDPFRPIVLWAPTFEMELSGIPIIWNYILELTKFTQVIIKFHEDTNEFFKDHFQKLASENEDLWYVRRKNIVPFMQIADLLITDVSSVMFEFLTLDRPIVLVNNPLMKSYKHYNAKNIEYIFREIAPEISVGKDLVNVINQQLKNPNEYSRSRKRIARKILGNNQGLNCANIINDIELSQNLKYPTFEVVIKSEIDMDLLQDLRKTIGSLTKVYIPKSSNIKSSDQLIHYCNDLELRSFLENSTAELLIIFEKKCLLEDPWKKQLLLPFRKRKEIDMLAPLTTNGNQSIGYMLWYLDLLNFNPAGKNTFQDYNNILYEKNIAQRIAIPYLESPLFVVKKTFYCANFESWDTFGNAIEIRKFLATDVAVQEFIRR